jgi:pyruvate formate lyase activating enzyme
MVSNGFINKEPLEELLPDIDAFNIDLKAFRDDFYRKQTGAHLDPVLHTLKAIKKAGKHLEITNLIIPGLNDDPSVFREMISWISEELGRDTVLHLSRYFPQHKLKIESTPVDMLVEFYALAMKKLDYVYLGNVDIRLGNMTRCAVCDELLIKRQGYITSMKGLTEDMRCTKCGETIQNMVI